VYFVSSCADYHDNGREKASESVRDEEGERIVIVPIDVFQDCYKSSGVIAIRE